MVTSAFLITAAAVSQAAPAASADTTTTSDREATSPLPAVDGLTSDEVRAAVEYLRGRGLSEAHFENFAHYLGVSLPKLYLLATTESIESAGGEVQPPVEIVDGKVRDNSAVVNNIDAIRTKTEAQVGQLTKSQECASPAIEANDDLDQYALSEATELDPENCLRVIVSASYDLATWRAPAPAVVAHGDRFISGFSCKDGKWPETRVSTLFSPNRDHLDGEHRRYYKQAFVDLICMSITSSALSVTWNNHVSSTNGLMLIDRDRKTYDYTQLGRHWVNKVATLTPSTQPVDRANSVYARLTHTRTETDFRDYVFRAALAVGSAIPGIEIIASTAAIFVASGGHLGDTYFSSWRQFELLCNGGWSPSGCGRVAGGCSNLVHEQVWHGAGKYGV